MYSPPIPPKKSPAFDFRAAMLAAGVSAEAADAWLQVRKTKRATNTKIAWDAVVAEFSKTSLTPDECIRYAVRQSWAGFKVAWMEEEERRHQEPTAPAPRQPKGKKVYTAVSDMLALGRELFAEDPAQDLPDYDQQ